MENNYAESLRRETLSEFNNSIREFSKSSCQQETEANKLMFNLSTFTIPLSMVAISSEKISKLITLTDKHLIFFSWLFLIISAIFGIVKFDLRAKYFDKWAEQESKRSDCFSKIIPFDKLSPEDSLKNYFLRVEESNKFDGMPNRPSKIIDLLQYIFTSIGMIIFLFVLTKVLFQI